MNNWCKRPGTHKKLHSISHSEILKSGNTISIFKSTDSNYAIIIRISGTNIAKLMEVRFKETKRKTRQVYPSNSFLSCLRLWLLADCHVPPYSTLHVDIILNFISLSLPKKRKFIFLISKPIRSSQSIRELSLISWSS